MRLIPYVALAGGALLVQSSSSWWVTLGCVLLTYVAMVMLSLQVVVKALAQAFVKGRTGGNR